MILNLVEILLDLFDGHFSERKYIREKLNIPSIQIAKTKHDHNPLNDCKYITEEYWIIRIWIRK